MNETKNSNKVDFDAIIKRAHDERRKELYVQYLRDLSISQRENAKAIRDVVDELKEEKNERSQSDKKYFWLGALVSFVISMTVQHGPALIQFLLQLIQ